MKRLIVSIILVSLMVVPISAFADDCQPLETEEKVESLLTAFPELLTEEIIAQLREQGYGYGQIAKICTIATQSNTSITEVINYAKESNLGWGEVAKHFGAQYINSKGAKECECDNCQH